MKVVFRSPVLLLACMLLSGGCSDRDVADDRAERGGASPPSQATSARPQEKVDVATEKKADEILGPPGNELPASVGGDAPHVAIEPSPPQQRERVSLVEAAVRTLESGDSQTAFSLIRKAKAANPSDPQTNFILARVLAERNRFAEAINTLDELAAADPEVRLPALGQTAEWLVIQGRFDEAEKRYRQLLDQVDPDSGLMVHRQLAQLLLRQGRRVDAANHLRVLCRGGNIELAELRALLCLAHPLVAEATAEEEDQEPIGALGEARQALARDELDSAAEMLVEASGPHERALLGRIAAQAFLRDGTTEKLQQWISGPAEQSAKNADYWFAMGVHHQESSQPQEAVEAFRKTIQTDSTDADAYRELSRSLVAMGEKAAGEQAEQKAEWVEQTQEIGQRLDATQRPDVEDFEVLADTLEKLGRHFESLAWQAYGILFRKSTGQMTPPQAALKLQEINRQRMEKLQAVSE